MLKLEHTLNYYRMHDVYDVTMLYDTYLFHIAKLNVLNQKEGTKEGQTEGETAMILFWPLPYNITLIITNKMPKPKQAIRLDMLSARVRCGTIRHKLP